ncbi:MAG: 50S ribosomal protein L10 [Clostridia bacterium]|nr:50S ribosomal protein L10 [Clostridia bacterium]
MEKKPQLVVKEQEVAELEQLFNASSVAILTDYRGITVSEDVRLRAKLRNAGVEYRVAKNTLIRIACNNYGSTELDSYLNGPTAIAFAEDPVAAAKIISEFIRESKKTKIKAALLTGKLVDAAGVEALAKLPPREVLLAQVAGIFAAPMANFAGVASAMLRQLVTVVDKVREQKSA